MMRLLVVILSVACLFSGRQNESAAPGASNCVPVYTTVGKDVAYEAGEKLDFVLHYKWGIINSDIGTASITLDTLRISSSKAFHCRVQGRTIRIFDKFFRVREDFNSYFSYNGLKPIRFTRDTHEGSYTAENEYNYMWDAAKPYIDAKVFTSSIDSTKYLRLPLKECTFDLPSLFFFARNIDMSKVRTNVRYPMTFAIDDDIYDVYFIYRGKATRKVKGLGTVKCLKFAAKLLEGEVFKGDADLDIYISDDLNRLPVLFGAPISVGEVEGRMVSYEGLKYPMTSLVEKEE